MKIYHIYSSFDNMTSYRYELAKNTWKSIDTIKIEVSEKLLEPNVIDDGYRKVPYVKDIINKGIELINNCENYIILFTNSDTCVFSKIIADLQKVDDVTTQVYSRKDVESNCPPLKDPNEIKDIGVCVGKDGFAFTKNYWTNNQSKFLNMAFAAEFWDYIFYLQFKMYSDMTPINDKLYHRKHEPNWYKPDYRYTSPSQVYNVRLARDFLRRNIDIVDRYDHMKEWENDVFLKV
jgi:hypothetical protein